MKKWIAMALVLVMTMTGTALAQSSETAYEYVTRTGYGLVCISDVFALEDGSNNELVIQGRFGDIDMSQGENDPAMLGFDEQQTFSLGLAENAVVLMPANMDELFENVACTDFEKWFADAKEDTYPELEIYASFSMNEKGDFISLEYQYMPFQ